MNYRAYKTRHRSTARRVVADVSAAAVLLAAGCVDLTGSELRMTQSPAVPGGVNTTVADEGANKVVI
jgi:hypothetical protein